jgi:hypothetical protein
MARSVRQHPFRGLALTVSLLAASTATGGDASAAPLDGIDMSATSAYVAFGPIRLADTRAGDGECGCHRVNANTVTVDIAGRDGMPDYVVAVSVTVTAPATVTPGFVTLYPNGAALPGVSTLNTRSDRAVANSAIVQVGDDGRIAVYHLLGGDVALDLTGVFVAATTSRSGRFVPVAPRRLVDTRQSAQLPAGGELDVALPEEAADDAVALAVTVTSVGERAPGFLSARPAGTPPTATSFVNINGSGQAVAASTIVPVSASGFTIASHSGGHVVVDLLGWFTGPAAAESGTGLFVPIVPERLLDTRQQRPRVWPNGTVELPVDVTGAGSLVTNVTATRSDRAGFVTAYPAGTPRPPTSTLNPAMFEHTLANMALTGLSDRGLAYYSLAGVDLAVDVTGLFTGSRVSSTEPAAPNVPGSSRVLMVGDSTLAGLNLHSEAQAALLGFEPIVDAASCRRLVRTSCLSAVTNVIPNTAVEAIYGTPGVLDIVVIKTGYNDWNSNFPAEFDAVVNAARAKGAHTIVWLSYAEDVASPRGHQAYVENNIDLFGLVTLPQYRDVLLADWRGYTAGFREWTWDGSHLTAYGAWLTSDYISRWVAAIEHKPCPRPWGPGGASYDPCPVPDTIGPVPDVTALY